MATINRQLPATLIERECSAGDPAKALFRAVLAMALKDSDVIQWLRSDDGRLVTELADVDRDWVLRVIGRG